ncbi:hypothetical protein D9M69_715140 [compost metagenome]
MKSRAAQVGFETVEVGVVGGEAVADEGVVTDAYPVALGNQDGIVVDVATIANQDPRARFPGLDMCVAIEEMG